MMLKPRLPGYAPDHMIYITPEGKTVKSSEQQETKTGFLLLSHILCSLSTQFYL